MYNPNSFSFEAGIQMAVSQPTSWLSSSEVQYRTANLRDLRRLSALSRECFGKDSWPLIDFLLVLVLPGTIRHLALDKNELIGFVIADRRRGMQMGWIASIAVHPAYQRQGIGQGLLKLCEQALAMPRVRLTLRPSNQAAKSLYGSAGYEQVDTWQAYYHDGEDGMVMEKKMPVQGIESEDGLPGIAVE